MAHYEFSLRDYTVILHKRKFLILLCVLAGIACSIVMFPESPPVYESSTTVKIEERKTIAGLLTEWIVYNPGDSMASQAKIINGFPIIKKVALRLSMIKDNSPESEIHQVVSQLQNKITAERDGNTNIIKITASSDTPEEAQRLASSIANVYAEENLLEKTEQVRSTRAFIEEQLSILGNRLKETEEDMKALEDEAGNSASLKTKKRTSDPIQDKLVKLRFDLVNLSQRYTNKHPQILRLHKEISDLEKRQEQANREIYVAQDNSSDNKLEYARLSREVEINKKLYMMFKERLEEARITEAEKIGDISIVDPAVLPVSPVKHTQRTLNILLGGLLGLILGMGFAFILEALDTSLATIEEIEKVIKLPVLGVVPSAISELKQKDVKLLSSASLLGKKGFQEACIRTMTHTQPKSLMAEAFRNIRTNLRLGPSKKTILITSVGTQEGKTTIMVNLGLAVAQTGAKTLLVSSDLRRPAVANTFGINKEPGMSELISGTATLDESLRNLSDIILGNLEIEELTGYPGLENLWILPSGHRPHNPAEVLNAQKNASIIDELKRKFDIIFFDSPPVLAVTDASLLASKVDSVILCYEIGKASRDALMRAKNQLESVDAKISGIVLNQIRLQKGMTSYHYYYNYHDRYYGDDEPGERRNTQEHLPEGFKSTLDETDKDSDPMEG